MDRQEALWYVLIKNERHGPLTKAKVLDDLRDGILTGSDLVWRPGFSDWKKVSEVGEFSPPPRTRHTASVESDPDNVQQTTDAPPTGRKFSLWRSANIGLLVGALLLLIQIGSGRGFELANYAHTASAGTIGAIIGQTIWVSLVLVPAAMLLNLALRRKMKPSGASAVWGALTFVALLVAILGCLKVYGDFFFTGTDLISGEARKSFAADAQRACVRKQRSLGLNVTETQIDKYCGCMSEQVARKTTYKDLGGEFDPSSTDMKQKIEAAITACR
jgi:GYF domain 2